MPWYTIHTTCLGTYLTCLSTHHYTPYMIRYMPLDTLYALVQPLHILHTLVHITAHLLYLGTNHYTPYMPWYIPLFTTSLGTHHILGTHHYIPYVHWYIPLHTLYALLHTLHGLVPTSTYLICWYAPLHTSYALVHTIHTLHALVVQYATPSYIIRNPTLKKMSFAHSFSFNNCNSIILTKLKPTVHIVGVLTYIHIKLQVSMMNKKM